MGAGAGPRARPAAPPPASRTGSRERIAEHGLQPLRWPATWPPDTELAMLAATYAKHIGRAVAFSLAAFRQAFAGGRDLGEEGTVLIAAAACEMHPTALLKGMSLRSVTAAAWHRGRPGARDAGVDVAARDRGRRRSCSAGPAAWRQRPALAARRADDEGQPRLSPDRLPRRAGSRRSWPSRDALDRIEVVSVDDEEIVLYWDLPVKQAARAAQAAARRSGRARRGGVHRPSGRAPT